jgi:DNA polymerase-1
MARVFLLDGTALAYRAHFALHRSGLTTPEGKPIGAVYGFASTLNRLIETEKPDAIGVAFDPPGETFRHKRYEEYKATRQKMPDELVHQHDILRELVRAQGIALYEVRGYEADDVIGTLAIQAAARGDEVMIVTGDKDLMQLIGPRVALYNVFKPGIDLVIEREEAVKEKFGCAPAQVIDVLAIMGDASDNVPGVQGIGEKGAAKLVQELGGVDAILANLDKVKGKAREHIERDRENLLLSRELVTIRHDVPLDPGIEALHPARPDTKQLMALYHRLGFQSLAAKAQKAERPPEARDYVLVSDATMLAAMVQELRRAPLVAIDTETTGLDARRAAIVGASFSAAAMRAFYVPFNADPPVLAGGPRAILEALRPLLLDREVKLCGQNTKYDWLVYGAAGLELPPPAFDTMIASFCAHGSSRRHNLDELALSYFDIAKIPTTALIGTGRKQVTMAEVPVAKVAEYACEDADVTFRLVEPLSKELVAHGATQLFEELEMPLVPVLVAMERRGIRLDTRLLEQAAKEMEAELSELTARIHHIAEAEFNINSPKALGEVLFEKLKIHEVSKARKPKKTQTGWATDAETLEGAYGEVEIVKLVLAWRELMKLKGTYVDALPACIDPATGRVHTSYSQVSAATGRLASSDPNLQNIPVRTERGRAVRKAFVPREPDALGEWTLVSFDYSQVELRVLAHLCGDPGFAKAFAEGKDIHAATAATIFGVMPELVTREMRSQAKAINFGLLYGMGPTRLARETGMGVPEAREFVERYFASFPAVKGWIERTLAAARRDGHVETILGRRRRFPEINSEDPRVRVFAENAAVNTPVQGSAADIIKRAMIDIERDLPGSGLAAQLLLQVHDELVFEVPLSELDRTIPFVRERMEQAVPLKVPLKVDVGHGANWLEAH